MTTPRLACVLLACAACGSGSVPQRTLPPATAAPAAANVPELPPRPPVSSDPDKPSGADAA